MKPLSVVGRRPSVVHFGSTVAEALHQAAVALAHTDAPAVTAQALLGHVLGLDRAQVLARPERTLSTAEQQAFAALAARAGRGEPLAYLTGAREFCGLSFEVNADVLVPRPETELLVELALRLSPPPRRIVDVGTGSGCVAVTLAARLPEARVSAADVSRAALAVARRNAERHGVAHRTDFVLADLFEGMSEFNLIVANLPYIDSDELKALPVARHEPRLALDGGPGGLVLVERLLDQAPGVLAPGGSVLLEIGAGQGARASALARAAFPGARVLVHPDWAGLDRVVQVTT